MKRTKQSFLLLIVLLFLLSSCKTTEGTDEGVKTYSCTGSNPFWKAEINNNGIEFSLLGSEKVKYPYKKPVETSERKLFVTSVEIDGKKSWLKISIEEGTCNTSAAGKKFPLKVEADKDGMVYYGCGK